MLAAPVAARDGVPVGSLARLRQAVMVGDGIALARSVVIAAEEGGGFDPARTHLDRLASALEHGVLADLDIDAVYGIPGSAADAGMVHFAFERMRTAVLSAREGLDHAGGPGSASAALTVVARDLDGTIVNLLRRAYLDSENLSRRPLANVVRSSLARDVTVLDHGKVPATEPSAQRRLASAATTIVQALNDLRDADLTGVRLWGAPLEGVRWSAGTRWPPRVEKRLRRRSREVEPGVLEVWPR